MPMVMGPDPVWCHPAPAWSGGQDLVLCLRPTPLLNTKGWQMLLQALDHFSAQSRSKVIWLAFHGDQDAALWNDLDQQGLIPAGLRERSLQMRAESLDQVQRLFSKAALVIAMRLHALILAATTGCPTAALSYDPKVKAAAQLANLPWLDLAHPLEVQAMTRQWTKARQHPSSTSTIQSSAIQRMCIAQCSSTAASDSSTHGLSPSQKSGSEPLRSLLEANLAPEVASKCNSSL